MSEIARSRRTLINVMRYFNSIETINVNKTSRYNFHVLAHKSTNQLQIKVSKSYYT